MTDKENWISNPDAQGWWWHWTGDQESAPFMYSVMVSHTGTERYFIAFPDSRWCDEVGGLWIKAEEPKTWHNAAEYLPAPEERCQDSHCFVDQTAHCDLEKGHKGDHKEDAMLVSWPNRDTLRPASTNSSAIPAKEEEKESEFYCSFTSSGEHALSPMGDCLYCGSKGRPHKLRPAEVEAKDKPAKEECDHSGCKHDNKCCCICGEIKVDKPTKEREQVEGAKNRLFEAIDAWPNTFYGLQKAILEAHALLVCADINSAPQPSDQPTQKEAHLRAWQTSDYFSSGDAKIFSDGFNAGWNAALSHKEKPE